MEQATHGVIGLTGASVKKIGGFSVSNDHIVRLEMPQTFKGEGIQRAINDLDILSKIFSEHPEESGELFDAVMQNRMADAMKIVDQIGLREENFIKDGGGCAWLVAVAVGVAIVLYASDAE